MARRPDRVVGRARPTDHPVPPRQERQDRHHHHADRRAQDVRQRVERDLAAVVRGGVAHAQRGEGVTGLVQRGREHEDHEPGEEQGEQLG